MTPDTRPDPSGDHPHMADLSEYRGTFEDGWTDEDVASVLPRLSADLGLPVVCVWEYDSQYGAGGSSDLAILSDAGTALELPEGLWQLLVDGQGSGEILPEPGGEHDDIDLEKCFDYEHPSDHQYHYEYRND
jgi:hypothetical protein